MWAAWMFVMCSLACTGALVRCVRVLVCGCMGVRVRARAHEPMRGLCACLRVCLCASILIRLHARPWVCKGLCECAPLSTFMCVHGIVRARTRMRVCSRVYVPACLSQYVSAYVCALGMVAGRLRMWKTYDRSWNVRPYLLDISVMTY